MLQWPCYEHEHRITLKSLSTFQTINLSILLKQNNVELSLSINGKIATIYCPRTIHLTIFTLYRYHGYTTKRSTLKKFTSGDKSSWDFTMKSNSYNHAVCFYSDRGCCCVSWHNSPFHHPTHTIPLLTSFIKTFKSAIKNPRNHRFAPNL